MTIQIMNVKRTKPSKPYDFYVDRRTPLGNPFYMRNENDRDEVCEKYENWFLRVAKDQAFYIYLEEIILAYKEHEKVRLFCNCSPKRCHAETIKQYIEFYIERENDKNSGV